MGVCMFPQRGFSGLFYRLAGECYFLDRVQSNVLKQIVKVKNGRAHTFLCNNGQTEDGISQNTGAARYYTWQNTLIDCREMPGVVNSLALDRFAREVEATSVFQTFQRDLAERSGGFLKAHAFVRVMQGHNNKRYNIRLNSKSKYEEFDIVRTGIQITAGSPEDFKMGLYHLLNWEKRNHPDYRGLLIIPEKAPA